MKKTWPTLYKKTSTGATQEWTVSVDGNAYTTRFGQMGGKIQEAVPTICEGKNIGRANSTTPEEQAYAEAEALWTKKLKKDYSETLDKALKGESSDLIEGGILLMLAHKYSEQASKIKWPASCQRKLDGHRCIAIVDAKGKCTLWSRTRKPINSVPHIVEAIEKQRPVPGIILDGELFAENFNENFEVLTSLIRASKPKTGHEAIQYWVYDQVSDDPFSVRSKGLAGLKKPLVTVETEVVINEEELFEAFGRYIGEKFEGAMVRNNDSPYENKRSYNLLKVKERDDAEFVITGVEEGRGKLVGHGIFVVKTNEGKEFKAKMKGDTDKLQDYFKHSDKYIGKKLTVAFQGLTADGIPRFPVGLRLREVV